MTSPVGCDPRLSRANIGGSPEPPALRTLIRGVFGGLSKGEGNRIKIRVRSAVAAMFVDASPASQPTKATDGKRLWRVLGQEGGRHRAPINTWENVLNATTGRRAYE